MGWDGTERFCLIAGSWSSLIITGISTKCNSLFTSYSISNLLIAWVASSFGSCSPCNFYF